MTDTYGRLDENTVRCDTIKQSIESIRSSNEFTQLKKASIQILVKERTGRELTEEEVSHQIEFDMKKEELAELQLELSELKSERQMLMDLLQKGDSKEKAVAPEAIEKVVVMGEKNEGSSELAILESQKEILALKLQLQGNVIQYNERHQVQRPAQIIEEEPEDSEPADDSDEDKKQYWTCRSLPFPTVLTSLLFISWVIWVTNAVEVDYRIPSGIWIGLSMQLLLLVAYVLLDEKAVTLITILAAATFGYLLMASPLLVGSDANVVAVINCESQIYALSGSGARPTVAAVAFILCLTIDFIIVITYGFKKITYCPASVAESKPRCKVKNTWIIHVATIVFFQVTGWLVTLGGTGTAQHEVVSYYYDYIFTLPLRQLWYSVVLQFFTVIFVCIYCIVGLSKNVDTWRIPAIGLLVLSTGYSMSLTDLFIEGREIPFKIGTAYKACLAGNIISNISNYWSIIFIGNRRFYEAEFKPTQRKVYVPGGVMLFSVQVLGFAVYFAGLMWLKSVIPGSSKLMRSDWWALAMQAILVIAPHVFSMVIADIKQWCCVVMALTAIGSQFILYRTSVYFEFSRLPDNFGGAGGVSGVGALLCVVVNIAVIFIHGQVYFRKMLFLSKPKRSLDPSLPGMHAASVALLSVAE